MDAFYHLSIDAARFVRDHLDQDRQSAEYAFVLFTYALYLEYAGDLWRAHDRYHDVCMLVETVLQPKGIEPRYNGVSILRLCIAKTRKLGGMLSTLGARPTVVTILQSTEQPGPEHFRARIRQRLDSETIETEILARDETPAFAYMRALDALPESADGNRRAQAVSVVKGIAGERKLAYLSKEEASVSVLAFGVEESRVESIAKAMDAVALAFGRFADRSLVAEVPSAFVVRGPLPPADASFLSAALNDGVEVPATAFHVNRTLRLVVGPEIAAQEPGQLTTNEYPLYYGAHLHEALGKGAAHWLDVTYLSYEGAGTYSIGNLHSLLGALMAAAGRQHALPFDPCPRNLPAVRLCAVRAGVFARFLDAAPSALEANRSALESLMQRRRELGAMDHAGVLQAVSKATGHAPEDLQPRFLAYVQKLATVQRGGAEADEIRKVADGLPKAFQAPR
jgi:hypothetical protein